MARVGTLAADQQVNYEVSASSCYGFLHVEVWDTDRMTPVPANEPKADPMLMVRYGDEPVAEYNENNEWLWSEDTVADVEGYNLLRPYHQLSVDMRPCADSCASSCASSSQNNCQVSCASTCEEPPRGGRPHVIGIYNVRYWVDHTLNYEVVATCVPANTPPCRRPKGIAAGDCAGHGICINATDDAGSHDVFQTNGVCSCFNGWGDVGCDKNLTRLIVGRSQTATVPVGEWAFFDVVVQAPPVYGLDPEIAMLVELRRTSGDPVLFVKEVDDPSSGAPGGGAVPAVNDYANYADMTGFRSRVNYHYKLFSAANLGEYYVAVLNNDVYLQEEATFTITVRTQLPPASPNDIPQWLCPANCNSPRGECVDPSGAVGTSVVGTSPIGTCRCDFDYGGSMCEGTLTIAYFGESTGGTITPGDWAYVKIGIEADHVEAGITITFTHTGGHPVLMLKQGGYPKLLDNGYVLSTTEHLERETVFRIGAGDLAVGEWILGVFNMNYYADADCEYSIVIEENVLSHYLSVTPGDGVKIIVVVLIVGMFTFTLLSIFRRCMHDRFMRRRRENLGNFPMGTAVDSRQLPPGCPQHVIDAIPLSTYAASQWDSSEWGKEEACCSVCIDAFEEGDQLRTLPVCGHAFHKDCIDEWLKLHTTCPNCRASMIERGRQSRTSTSVDVAPAQQPAFLAEALADSRSPDPRALPDEGFELRGIGTPDREPDTTGTGMDTHDDRPRTLTPVGSRGSIR